MTIKLLTALMICFWIAILAHTFNTSLPHWCDNPNAGGNWVVQPLCR